MFLKDRTSAKQGVCRTEVYQYNPGSIFLGPNDVQNWTFYPPLIFNMGLGKISKAKLPKIKNERTKNICLFSYYQKVTIRI